MRLKTKTVFGEGVDPDVKVYSKGHPDFEKLCQEITPLENVRSGFSHEENSFHAEKAPARRNRFKGVNEL